jgi:hypothetical protein
MGEDRAEELQDYSVYLLDGRGRIQAAHRLQAASDECALWKLVNLNFTHVAELWRRGRRIAAIQAGRPPS